MERILSEQFVTETLLKKYIKKDILGNIENDKRLQKIFTEEEPLTEDEKKGLVVDEKYFNQGTSVFRYDENLRKLFWNNFIDFVRRQKKICSGNIGLLAKRLLPKPGTNEYEPDAQQNLLKFAYQIANAVQDYKIEQQIKNQELNGEITKEKAGDLKSKLAQGKLVMVKDKNGRDKILEDEEIKRALANVAYQADLFSRVQISGEGEDLVLYPDEIPPEEEKGKAKFEEKGMTLSNLELEIYEKQATQIEVMLEDSGMFVEGKLKPDKTGMVRGYVVIIRKRGDKTITERMRIEVNVNKPNQLFQFTLLDKGKSFMADRNEIKKYFKDENKSADEVFDIKEKEKMENPLPFPAKAPEERKKPTEAPKEEPQEGLAATGPVPAPMAKSDFYRRSSAGATTPVNILAAKDKYLRKKMQRPPTAGRFAGPMPAPQAPAEEKYAQKPQPQQAPEADRSGKARLPIPQPAPEAPKKTLNPAKVTGIAVAAGLGTPMILSLFT